MAWRLTTTNCWPLGRRHHRHGADYHGRRLEPPGNGAEKTLPKIYRVHLSTPLTAQAQQQLHAGILLHGETKPCLPADLYALTLWSICWAFTKANTIRSNA